MICKALHFSLKYPARDVVKIDMVGSSMWAFEDDSDQCRKFSIPNTYIPYSLYMYENKMYRVALDSHVDHEKFTSSLLI